MAIRKDTVQLSVEINGQKAGKTYGELIKDSRALKRELNGLVPGTDAFVKKSAELKTVNNRLADIRKTTAGVQKGISSFQWTAIIAGAALAFRSVLRYGKEFLTLYDVQAKADAQLKAAIASTNGAAGRSFEQLKQQAADLQKQTLFGDEQTQEAQGVLLTFTKIQGTIYDQAIPAVLDMATALKLDLKSASIQVGKALNDPIAGVTALGRAGVQFNDDQKAMIKSLVDTGDVAGAQNIILKELETQFKGSAKAAAEAGTGGLTQLSNRVSDIKESLGLLLNNGLKVLQPFLEKVVSFFEKLTESVISGKTATGEFSGAINLLIGLITFLSNGVQVLYGGFILIKDGIVNVITAAKDLPIIGQVIQYLQKGFEGFVTGLRNSKSVFAGLKAAFSQFVDNFKRDLNEASLSLQIFAKKADLFLSIKQSTKDRLSKEIQDLENLKKISEQSGRSVGEAYTDAYNKSLAEGANEAKAQQILAQPSFNSSTSTNVATNQSTSSTKSSTKAAKTKVDDKKAYQGINQFAISAQLLQDEFDKRGEVITNGLERELDEYEKAYLLGFLSENEVNSQRLEAKIEAFDEELQLLTDFNLQETYVFRQKELEKLRIQKELGDSRIAEAQREADFKKKINQEVYEITLGFLELGIEALGRDAEAKKKNAELIKAFEIGRITANLYSEISGYFAGYAAAGPVGQAIAITQAALATGRSALAVKKITSQQFDSGGHTGQGFLQDSSGHRVAGVVHDNEYVLPKWMVLNPAMQNTLSNLENIRKRGSFATGGFSSVQPTFNLSQSKSFDPLIQVFEKAAAAMSNINVTASVVYGEYEAKGDTLNYIKSQANA